MRVVLSASISDVLHQGHKNILEEMRRSGDKVIMVIHNDYACYRIKGKFPIQTTRHRKRNLLRTGLVDRVLVTKSIDPADQFKKVIKRYDNILFIRGDDNKEFPGKWIIDKNNIPIKFIKYTEGVSSTEIRNVARNNNETTLPE